MPEFILRVGTPDGEVIERQVVAASMRAAQDEMRRQGLHVFNARRGAFAARDLVPRFGRAVSTEHFLLFNQELLALVRAGLPIVQSFDILLERQKNPRFREILADIREKLTSGVALSDAFASYGDLFPPIYSTSIRAGERSGDLEGVIKRFLRYQKMIVNLRKKVIGALVYPLILMTMSGGMIFVMMTYVIPKFAEFFEGFGQELPWFTQLLINVAGFMRSNVLLIVGVTIVSAFLLHRWVKTGGGRLIWDRVKLRIPLVGGVLHPFSASRFVRTLGTLLAGGIPAVSALGIAGRAVGNLVFENALLDVERKVREGEPLWRSLDNTKVLSDLAVEMIKVGESTGALTEMLANVSEFYDEEIESRLARLVSAIEPIILIGMGLVIAGLLYAFYLPLFRLSQVGM